MAENPFNTGTHSGPNLVNYVSYVNCKGIIFLNDFVLREIIGSIMLMFTWRIFGVLEGIFFLETCRNSGLHSHRTPG